jgi:hypothetical protein
LEQRQRIELRGLHLEQRRDRRSEQIPRGSRVEEDRRRPPWPTPAQRRELDRKRLEMRLQRDNLTQ